MLTIYKASAGSGKTFTLAYRYIKTLLGVKNPDTGQYVLNSDKYVPGGRRIPNRHAGILAITFTNAATEEMKSRIVKELDQLASGKKSDYLGMLIKDLGGTEDELRPIAAKALGEILYDYGNFNVSTIDSFFQTVLRTFSREVDHQGDYELSLSLSEVLMQSVSQMLDELNYSNLANAKALRSFIRSYTFTKLGEGKSYNFFNRNGYLLTSLAASTASAIGEEIFINKADAVHQYLSDSSRIDNFEAKLNEAISVTDDDIKAAARTFIEYRDRCGIPSDSYSRYFGSYLDKALTDPSLLGPKDLTSSTLVNLTVSGAGTDSFFKSNWLKKNKTFGSELEVLHEHASRFAQTVLDGINRKKLYRTIIEGLPLLRFIGMAEEYLHKYLRDNNIVLISDTGDLLRRIIRESEMPFIYERLGMRLQSLLIDEFQDTSHLQWHNLRPLVANSISQGGDSLIIGDVKQAIYRFRNSDSSLLGVKIETEDFPTDREIKGSIPAENTNYRSSGGIVRFNNTLFSRLAELLEVDGYKQVVQTISPKRIDEPAYISLKFVDKDTEKESVMEEMVKEMLRQHSDGYRWRDILVLTRYREEARDLAEYIIRHYPEITILSDEALLLNSSPAVRTIMALLKLIEQSYGEEKQRSTSDDGKPRYASPGDIVVMISRFNYFKSGGMKPEEALESALSDDSDQSDSLKRNIMDIRAKNPANIVALIETIVELKIAPEQRRAEYAYIAALQDLAQAHCDSQDPSLAAFIAEYERHIKDWAIKASNDLDAVQIMTIHKSKGLERACVHIPFADWNKNNKVPEMWLPLGHLDGFPDELVPPLLRVKVSKSLRDKRISPFATFLEADDKAVLTDNLNLAYVAFTRAGRELCVHVGVREVGDWIRKAFQSPDTSVMSEDPRLMPLSGYYNKDEQRFVFGSPTHPDKSNGTRDLPQAVEAGEYKVVFRPDTDTLTEIDDVLAVDPDIGGEVPSQIVDDKPEFFINEQMEEAARRGNIMHSILASTRTLDDLPTAVSRARGDLSVEERNELLVELTDAFERAGDIAASWFDPVNKVYAERSIYISDTGESFRPDRVVVSPDGKATVIDYKFTSRPSKEHVHQVELYTSLLGRLGREKVEGYVWYPLLSKIVRV